MSLALLGNEGFSDLLDEFLTVFEPYARLYFKKRKTELNKYPELIGRFYEDLWDISAGGKRLRGFLVYLGYLVGGRSDLEKILPISLAIETIHTFLLIHDDVIDKSDTRHGKLTIHRRLEKLFGAHYGMSQAIIVGDIACFEAFALVNSSRLSAQAKVECQKKIYEVLLETAYGEALDVENSYKKASVDDIKQVTDLKTARYSFVGPLAIGAILAGKASSNQLDAISKFGRLVGVAFQLQDDLLGLFGDEKVLGKSVLSDMREGKNTLVIYKARELATNSDRQMLSTLWGKQTASKADLITVQEIVKRSGAYVWCTGEMDRLNKKANMCRSLISKDKNIQTIFAQMAQFIVSRRS
ncbi:MAG: polyprenyl synthetase family protein [Patescibacteria group bacterium]